LRGAASAGLAATHARCPFAIPLLDRRLQPQLRACQEIAESGVRFVR
jgi:hypothetical protein